MFWEKGGKNIESLKTNQQMFQTPVKTINSLIQNTKWKVNAFISNVACRIQEKVEFLNVDKIMLNTPKWDIC